LEESDGLWTILKEELLRTEDNDLISSTDTRVSLSIVVWGLGGWGGD